MRNVRELSIRHGRSRSWRPLRAREHRRDILPQCAGRAKSRDPLSRCVDDHIGRTASTPAAEALTHSSRDRRRRVAIFRGGGKVGFLIPAWRQIAANASLTPAPSRERHAIDACDLFPLRLGAFAARADYGSATAPLGIRNAARAQAALLGQTTSSRPLRAVGLEAICLCVSLTDVGPHATSVAGSFLLSGALAAPRRRCDVFCRPPPSRFHPYASSAEDDLRVNVTSRVPMSRRVSKADQLREQFPPATPLAGNLPQTPSSQSRRWCVDDAFQDC